MLVELSATVLCKPRPPIGQKEGVFGRKHAVHMTSHQAAGELRTALCSHNKRFTGYGPVLVGRSGDQTCPSFSQEHGALRLVLPATCFSEMRCSLDYVCTRSDTSHFKSCHQPRAPRRLVVKTIKGTRTS